MLRKPQNNDPFFYDKMHSVSLVLWTISSTCPFGVHKLLRFFCKLSFYVIIFVQETDARLKLILEYQNINFCDFGSSFI